MVGNDRPPRGYVYIYKMVNTASGTVFYVGQTRRGLQDRLREHKQRYARKWGSRTIELQWAIVLIRTVRACNAKRCERRWIREYGKRTTLTNKIYRGR